MLRASCVENSSESRYPAVGGRAPTVKACFSASEQAQVGSVLGFLGWPEQNFIFRLAKQLLKVRFASAYPFSNVAAFSSLLSFFQRSHHSGRRLKSSSAHTCGAELFGLSEILHPGRKGNPLVDVRQLLAISHVAFLKPSHIGFQCPGAVLGGHSTSCVPRAAAGLTLRWEEVCFSFECCWMSSLNTLLYSF